jgi:hypothetical protein
VTSVLIGQASSGYIVKTSRRDATKPGNEETVPRNERTTQGGETTSPKCGGTTAKKEEAISRNA